MQVPVQSRQGCIQKFCQRGEFGAWTKEGAGGGGLKYSPATCTFLTNKIVCSNS